MFRDTSANTRTDKTLISSIWGGGKRSQVHLEIQTLRKLINIWIIFSLDFTDKFAVFKPSLFKNLSFLGTRAVVNAGTTTGLVFLCIMGELACGNMSTSAKQQRLKSWTTLKACRILASLCPNSVFCRNQIKCRVYGNNGGDRTALTGTFPSSLSEWISSLR